jgi:hypothetical protein
MGTVALCLGCAGAAVACRQVAGITDNPPEALSTTVCGLAFGTTSCASCTNASCCQESLACSNSADCAPYATCLGGCAGDPACRSRCTADNPGATAGEVSALNACLASKCETACGLTCGGVAGYFSEPDAAAGCQSCLLGTACRDGNACGSSADCDAFVRCSVAAHVPFGADCQGTDAGTTLAAKVNADLAGACADACGIGGQWGCVGNVSWPHPTSSTVTLSLVTTDFNAPHPPIANLEVWICGALDLSCGSPLAEGTTDDNGSFVRNVSNQANLGEGLAGYWKVFSSQGYATQLLSWGVPLSAATFSYASSLVSEATSQAGLTALGIAVDPSLGMISTQAFDCAGNPAAGVEVTTDIGDPNLQIRELYGVTGLKATATDSTGIALFVNVPPGVGSLTATPVAIGKPSSRQSIQVQAGTWSYMPMVVTP